MDDRGSRSNIEGISLAHSSQCRVCILVLPREEEVDRPNFSLFGWVEGYDGCHACDVRWYVCVHVRLEYYQCVSERVTDRAMPKCWMSLQGHYGKPILNRPQGWENRSVTVRVLIRGLRPGRVVICD